MSKNSGCGCGPVLFLLVVLPLACFGACAACTAGVMHGAQTTRNQTSVYEPSAKIAPSVSVKKPTTIQSNKVKK